VNRAEAQYRHAATPTKRRRQMIYLIRALLHAGLVVVYLALAIASL
jgi:hypothetical protein